MSVVPLTKRVSEESLRRAVREMYFWRHTDATNFTARLFDLFLKADPVNLERLKLGFPAEALAVELWRMSASEQKFFEEHGVIFNNGEIRQ